MLIPNPTYDVVFRILFEDNAIAKPFISALIDKEVLDLNLSPQYMTTTIRKSSSIKDSQPLEPHLCVFRLDFAARISTPHGSQLVIIEIQKAKFATDIMRFRRYIGNQYYHQYTEDGVAETPLPIISIFFIMNELPELERKPVVRVARSSIDVNRKKTMESSCEFIGSLTHDSVIISIPALEGHRRNELEQFLSIFDQSQKTWDHHLLDIREEGLSKTGMQIISRLNKELEQKCKFESYMAGEDELLRLLTENEREVANQNKIIYEKDQALEEKDRIIAELKQKLGLL